MVTGTFTVEDHLQEEWVDEWIKKGLEAFEADLRKHANFDQFLESREENTGK